MLRFSISTHFLQMFTFEKSSLRCVILSFLTSVPVTILRLVSQSICEPHLCYSDAYVGILYHFLLMMQAQWLAVWVETRIRYIKYIMRFFLFIACRVQILLLPTMKSATRKLLLMCKMFCSMKREHQGRILWNGHDISSTILT
jgi:hypothetical protein